MRILFYGAFNVCDITIYTKKCLVPGKKFIRAVTRFHKKQENLIEIYRLGIKTFVTAVGCCREIRSKLF